MFHYFFCALIFTLLFTPVSASAAWHIVSTKRGPKTGLRYDLVELDTSRGPVRIRLLSSMIHTGQAPREVPKASADAFHFMSLSSEDVNVALREAYPALPANEWVGITNR